MGSTTAVKLNTMLADYPITLPLKQGKVATPNLDFNFVPVTRASAAFKRVVRDMEFDLAELAIITFLIAKSFGKPLVLLPAVMVGRFQHPFLIYNASRGTLKPEDLHGKKVGIRSFSVTTGAWVRGILGNDHGIDISKVTWVTFEEPHVAEFQDPPNVVRAAAGKDMISMLRDGEIDAAIAGENVPDEPWVKTLIADPAAAAKDWEKRNGALQINHMLVVTEELMQSSPETVKEIFAAFAESRRLAIEAGAQPLPFGVEANRHNLEIAIDYAFAQQLIPRRFTVDELFNDATRALK